MESELIVNLWAYYDANEKLIYALSGRVYNANGTNEEKLALLKKLAATDYIAAKKYKVPERFAISYTNGERRTGVTFINAVYDPYAQLFNDMFINLENELPPLLKFTGSDFEEKKQSLSDAPLTVITVLYEDAYANIRPLITDEDRAWADQQDRIIHGEYPQLF